MKSAVKKFIITFLVFVAVFVLQKLIFVTFYQGQMGGVSVGDVLSIIGHGLWMDCSMAAYLTVVPALAIIAELWTQRRWPRWVERGYFIVVAILLAVVTVLDLILYGYWGFRLDTTPIFYFTTSPASAMASARWWELVVGIFGMALIAYCLCRFIFKAIAGMKVDHSRRGGTTAVIAALTALLFIPIRGGVTVSTMNPSYAYFSTNERFNHAALNPMFTLLYSATHQTDFGKQYRFMTADEVVKNLKSLNDNAVGSNNLSDTTLLNTKRPDVWLVILESFSAHLMPGMGGAPVALRLDSIAKGGLLFTNFYASSFRTDRALPAILSGFPGQPSTSVMKFVDKASRLPSIARELAKSGYDTEYYYGGDANFTNMKAYLVNAGFGKIVSDSDFPLSEKASKWGAPDHALFARALKDAGAGDGSKAAFRVVQTSSSHEPFEVPYSNERFADNERLNAFAYADSCLGAFVDSLQSGPRWDKTLIVIVPDHFGVWPEKLDDPVKRHHVPLVIAGGALNVKGQRADIPASQTDIAASLLGLLGLDHSMFEFSHDVFSAAHPGYAFFSDRTTIGLVTPADTAVVNADSGEATLRPHAPSMANEAKAYLQHLYDTINSL